MRKSIKAIIAILLVIILFIIIAYILRLDRFGLSKISWSDCVKINNVKYYSNFEKETVNESLIDKKIGEVKFNVSKKVTNSEYKFRNGDATFLEEETKIYSLKSQDDAIAVKVNEEYFIYKIDNK